MTSWFICGSTAAGNRQREGCYRPGVMITPQYTIYSCGSNAASLSLEAQLRDIFNKPRKFFAATTITQQFN